MRIGLLSRQIKSRKTGREILGRRDDVRQIAHCPGTNEGEETFNEASPNVQPDVRHCLPDAWADCMPGRTNGHDR